MRKTCPTLFHLDNFEKSRAVDSSTMMDVLSRLWSNFPGFWIDKCNKSNFQRETCIQNVMRRRVEEYMREMGQARSMPGGVKQ